MAAAASFGAATDAATIGNAAISNQANLLPFPGCGSEGRQRKAVLTSPAETTMVQPTAALLQYHTPFFLGSSFGRAQSRRSNPLAVGFRVDQRALWLQGYAISFQEQLLYSRECENMSCTLVNSVVCPVLQ